MGTVRYFVLLIISGVVHMVAAIWVLSTLSAEHRERWQRPAFGIAAALSLILGSTRAYAPSPFGDSPRARSIFVSLFAVGALELGIVILSLMLIGVTTLLIRGAYRFVPKAKPLASKNSNALSEIASLTATPISTTNQVTLSRRQTLERGVGLTIVTATAGTLGWGLVRGRHEFVIEEVTIPIKNWPRTLEGYTIAQISDLHVGMFIGESELQRALDAIATIRPDILVATGDLVDFDSEQATVLARALTRAKTRDGVYAILGNHDHYAGPSDVASYLQSANIRVLSNDAVILRPQDASGFALAGVDDLYARRRPTRRFPGPDLAKALQGIRPDQPRILLAHQPKYFDEAAGRIDLQLSGHTHGGQINPGITPANLFMRYVAGRYTHQGSTLYVNRGLGVSGPPARINAPPEITKITLTCG